MGNYLFHFEGRMPKIGGDSCVHAVNNYFYSTPSTGHAFEILSGGNALVEGNIFQNCALPIEAGYEGKLFTGGTTQAGGACETYLGRACVTNAFGSSGALSGTDTSFFGNFTGYSVASATTAEVAKNVPNTAGFGLI